ncbi:MAG: SBBP repeat-containing protein [Ignavibacteriales bacterium]|nr:SBBP repeat-containing protein [Ignavibacteriales bacterium]
MLHWAKAISSNAYYDEGGALAIGRAGEMFILQERFGWDIVLAKMSNNGDIYWAKSIDNGYTGLDFGRSIVLDSGENIYIAGVARNGVNSDMAVIKMFNNGIIDWAKMLNSSNNSGDDGRSIALDSENIYVTGYSNNGSNIDIVVLQMSPDQVVASSFITYDADLQHMTLILR